MFNDIKSLNPILELGRQHNDKMENILTQLQEANRKLDQLIKDLKVEE